MPSRHAPERNVSRMRLHGLVALITGANRGIGLAIARALSAEGCDLVITARNHAELAKRGRELARYRNRVLAHACDVRHPESVKQLISAIRKQFRRLDILINNAGVAHANRPVSDLPVEDWNTVIATNLTGMFLVTRAALPLLRPGSSIVNNLSIAATRAFAGSSAYNASKHGALGFTNSLREELRSRKIRVIALMPGATDTDIWNSLWPDAPRAKMMNPETIAAALVSALVLPENSTVEELTLMPTAGVL